MSAARSFRDLRVYQLARTAVGEIFEISKGFPREERYALTDQIRRSARATKAMIAEAWARRRYKAVFVNKLDEALGEASETQAWLDDALDSGYIDSAQFSKMDAAWRWIGGMIGRMIDRAADFCKYASDTDYRGAVMEGPLSVDEIFLMEWTISHTLTNKKIPWLVALMPGVRRRPPPITNH
jgi:four helix bundle protein